VVATVGVVDDGGDIVLVEHVKVVIKGHVTS
jgi:hypothetical protein